MTICRSFIGTMKATAPKAFSTDPPNVSVVFINGQLKLQIPDGINEWYEFYQALFQRMLDRYLAMDGMKTIILGFDDSANSPAAKAATQAKRRSKFEKIDWSALQPLPPTIPANHGQLLMNRVYKSRVISFIVEQVTMYCKVKPGQRIIIDY